MESRCFVPVSTSLELVTAPVDFPATTRGVATVLSLCGFRVDEALVYQIARSGHATPVRGDDGKTYFWSQNDIETIRDYLLQKPERNADGLAHTCQTLGVSRIAVLIECARLRGEILGRIPETHHDWLEVSTATLLTTAEIVVSDTNPAPFA